MRCPRCQTTLDAMEYEDTLIHSCCECGGEFVAGDALGAIVRSKREGFSPELLEELAERTPIHGLRVDDAQHMTSCPVCERAMHLVNYGGDTGVYIDRCSECQGVWLDSEELEKIQILQERWSQDASTSLRTLAGDLEFARMEAAQDGEGAFQGSRFSFVNAVLNRILDAA